MDELRIKYCKYFPPKRFWGMQLFGYLIRRESRKDEEIPFKMWNHESIHLAQCRDLGPGIIGFLLFYLMYGLEWLLKLPFVIIGKSPYYSISFEREAYWFQNDHRYLERRKKFEWTKYLFKLV